MPAKFVATFGIDFCVRSIAITPSAGNEA